MTIGGSLRQRGTWVTTMVAIASFYVVFAVETADSAEIIVHTGLAAGFPVLAIIGARASPWVLVAALFGHGIFDMEAGWFLASPSPDWWGPFCFSFDLFLAIALAVLLLRNQTID